ncbi:MAG: hypothetical protein ACPGIA_02900 [Luteolibacter sp.]
MGWMKYLLRYLVGNKGLRWVVALVLVGTSFWLMSKAAASGGALVAFFPVLISMSLLVLAAVVVAPSIARALVDKVVDFFMFSEKFDRPQPMYGRAKALHKSRQYDEAMKAYQDIAENYPDELKPHLEMIDIALRDLNDQQLAESIYQESLLMFEGAEDREQLARWRSGLSLRA